MRRRLPFPYTAGVNAYNDLTPRVGAAYDLFGNGKTAIKFNLGHYLAPATNDSRYTLNNPAATAKIVTSVARTWADDNGNFAVDCDILNPAAQSGAGRDNCGSITGNSLNFGKTGNNVAQVNEAMLHGWGVRPNDWQMGSQPAAGVDAARLARRRLQPPLFPLARGGRPGERHRQSVGWSVGLRRLDHQRSRSIRGSRVAAAIRLRAT